MSNQWLVPFFRGAVEVSLCLSPLLLALYFLRSRTIGSCSPVLRSLVWSLMALRLLFPFRLNPVHSAANAAPVEWGPFFSLEGTLTPFTAEALQTKRLLSLPWADLIAACWLIGAILFLTGQMVRHCSASRNLRRWSLPVRDDCTLAQLAAIQRELHMTQTVQLAWSNVTDSPVLTGLIHPTIYLPNRALTSEQLEVIFRHELTHLRRGDLWQDALLLGARAVHWFNPLVHQMALWAGQDQELACDAQALRQADGPARFAYGLTLLTLSQAAPSFHFNLASRFSANSDDLEKRIYKIAHPTRPRQGIGYVFTITALLSITFLLTGWAISPQLRTQLDEPANQSSSQLENRFEEQPAPTAGGDLTLQPPLEGEVFLSSPYGWRYNATDFHAGMDWTAEDIFQQDVRSAAGVVVYAGTEDTQLGTSYGRYVVIDHRDGWSTLYAHLDSVSTTVGQEVKAGESIGQVGKTGNATGPVLHFEVRQDGQYVDPSAYLPSALS